MTSQSLISRTWAITYIIHGRDKRTVTLAQYLAEVAAAKARVEPVADAAAQNASNTFSLPIAVIDWAGMQTRDGKYRRDAVGSVTLSEDNDSGKTFAEITDIIEAHIDEL